MDSNEPNLGSMNENLNRICPHLGLKDDAATSLAYPSAWNQCHQAHPLAIASLDHQRTHCLTAAHTTCPLFLATGDIPMPDELRSHLEADHMSRKAWRRMPVLALLFIVVGVIIWQVIARGFFSPPSQDGGGASAATQTALSLPLGATDPALTPPGEVTPQRGITPLPPTPTLAPTKLASPTPTAQPVLNLALEAPLGLGQRFMIHRVMEGESLELFARRYATTIEAIQAVNYYLPSPLLVNWTVVIPLESIDVQGLPAFQPIMVVGDMTVDEFARSNSVDVSTLSYFNALEVSYRLRRGDWLLVPREKVNK